MIYESIKKMYFFPQKRVLDAMERMKKAEKEIGVLHKNEICEIKVVIHTLQTKENVL